MLNIKTISYRRVFNRGNYQSEAIEITVEVEEGQNPDEVMAEAKQWVEEQANPTRKQDKEPNF